MFKSETGLHFSINSIFTHDNSPNTAQYYVYDSLLQATERMFSQLSFLEPHCHTDVSNPVQLKCQHFFVSVLTLQCWMALPQPRWLHKLSDILSSHWDALTCSLFMSTLPVQLFESVMAGGLPGKEWKQTNKYFFFCESSIALCVIFCIAGLVKSKEFKKRFLFILVLWPAYRILNWNEQTALVCFKHFWVN